MSEPARMHPADLAALADLVAARLAPMLAGGPEPERINATPRLLSAAEVAERFAVDRGWVYSHAQELGAVRLGDGPRGRLRFDPARVSEALASRESSRRSEHTGSPVGIGDPPRRSTRSKAARAQSVPDRPPLLPIRGQGGGAR